MRLLFSLCLFSIALAGANPAAASESASAYPSKPIRMIVTFPPGGPGDSMARYVGQKLTEVWGQSVIIDNRPGAGGTIGTNFVAKAAPDGYTLVSSSLGPMASAPFMYPNLPYDPLKDLAPITLAATSWFVLAVNPSVNAHSVKELIALAKEQPGRMTISSSGIATPSHLAAASFQSLAGIRLTHIPYKGGSESIMALVTGQVQMSLGTPSAIVPQVQAGKLRAILVAGPNRSPQLPGVPTASEVGLSGLIAGAWYGFHAPAGTPQPIIDKLNDAIVKIIQTPEMHQRFSDLGADATTDTPAQFGEFVAADSKRWGKVIHEAGIRLE